MDDEVKGREDSPRRLSFPEDEEAHQWLPMLLDAYSITDEGVAEAIRREEEKGKTLACGKGCSACCRVHVTIPIYPLELVGISWYATEKLRPPLRGKLKRQLKGYKESKACPFLVGDLCAIHPMRPMACRQFNVFGRVCEEGEDAYHTRREDVLTPIPKYMDMAFNAMLPFHGAKNRAQRRKAIKGKVLQSMARVMLHHNWASLAEKMEEYEEEHPELAGEEEK
ncbi:MAG: YkgJ family cysteine cluster protein [Euryarchaeota archaeon]|nr:YkgJ family cysteine cluster protein [Euryarchaeota archaeon]